MTAQPPCVKTATSMLSRVLARLSDFDDSTRSAPARAKSIACTPLQRDDWYAHHADANAAAARITVVASSTRCSRDPRRIRCNALASSATP